MKAVLIRKFWAILSEKGLKSQYSSLMQGYGVESLKQLGVEELKDLIGKLQDPKELIRRRRSIVLHLATKLGIHDSEDWSKFNGWMLQRSTLKKPLRDYTLVELGGLVQQLKKAEQNNEKAIENKFLKECLVLLNQSDCKEGYNDNSKF